MSLSNTSDDWKESFMSYLLEWEERISTEPGALEARGLGMAVSTIYEGSTTYDDPGINATFGPALSDILLRIVFLDGKRPDSERREDARKSLRCGDVGIGGGRLQERNLRQRESEDGSLRVHPESGQVGAGDPQEREGRESEEELEEADVAIKDLTQITEPILVTFGPGRGGFWIAPKEWEGRLVPALPVIRPRTYAMAIDFLLWFFRNIKYAVDTLERRAANNFVTLPLADGLEKKIRDWVREAVQENITRYLGEKNETGSDK